MLIVYNKCDIAAEIEPWDDQNQSDRPRDKQNSQLKNIEEISHDSPAYVIPGAGADSICISAKTGLGMENLKSAITQKLAVSRVEVSVVLPIDSGALVSRIYANGQVLDCQYQDDGIHITAVVTAEDEARLREVAMMQAYGHESDAIAN